MEKLRPQDVVHVVQIAEHDLLHDIERERPDLLICSAWCFLNVLSDIGAHPVATRKTDRAASAVASIGAALVVRSDRTDLRTLEDLRGKKAAATLPHSVDGYPAVRLMLREKGFSDEKFFSSVNFLTFTVPDVLSAVLSGDADVSILPACALERAQEEGLVEPGLLRVVGLPPDGALACSRSTDLYPDITAGILPWTPNELSRDFLTALLESGHADGYEWVATSDLRSVSNLYQELHLGRWAVLDDTSLSGLWKRYGRYAVFALLLVLLLIANECRLKRLVEHRTAALMKTLREKELLARKEEAARERLASLERMGAISQLCAMIAHELKQPMGAVLNFLAVLRMRCGESIKDDPVAQRAMEGAKTVGMPHIQLIPFIGGRVTDYAGAEVWVNARGERFVNEEERFGTLYEAILQQPDARFWVITDSQSKKNATFGPKLAWGAVRAAANLEEVAQAMEIPEAKLRETLRRYNEAVDRNRDDLFGRTVFTQRIDTPPYYFGEERFAVHFTCGGLAIDTHARVLDRSGNPIPGLFAAGETTGGIHGKDRLGGNSLIDCFVFGRIAGEEAAAGRK